MLKLIMYIKRVILGNKLNKNGGKLEDMLRKLLIGLVKKNYNVMMNVVENSIFNIIQNYSSTLN